MIFFEIFLSEAKRLLKDISVLTVCIIGPLVYFLLYPTPYANDVVKTQQIAIIDEDQTHLSRTLAFLADSSPEISIQAYATSLTQAQHLLEEGKIFGILYIPKGFEKDAFLQSSPHLAFLANSSYFLIYGAIINSLHEATEALKPTISEKQRLLYGIQTPHYQIQKELLNLKSSPLFNPSLGYINYALAAVFVVILHQMILVGMGIFGSHYRGKISPISLVFSRLILFGLLSIALFAFYFGFGFSFYGITRHAQILDFWLMSLAFIFAFVSMGNFFGALVKQAYQATIIILLCSLPLVFLLGFIWPSFAIPSPIQQLIQFVPVYHGVNALLRLNEMGASFYSVYPYFQHLIGLGIFYTFLALLVLYIKQAKSSSQKLL
ncbi:ABC transporter permease [Helicobacter kayseriensis]|uniref:ABC transporter permease n=1 Tax=Helicobacter kayseriensis TaxID=2905877 RepID=UPI001E5E5EDC|nr:ABC transporter permease [Helicobacter kayseriensis]MCE3046992.1 ABC transporter permease [Helicobacter kayseriensis]MCE3048348.1 ABC transporter permease [Helicobacter kayseriensis]